MSQSDGRDVAGIATLRYTWVMVDAVSKHLLTPFGVRTLGPNDPTYQGRYVGNVLCYPASGDLSQYCEAATRSFAEGWYARLPAE